MGEEIRSINTGRPCEYCAREVKLTVLPESAPHPWWGRLVHDLPNGQRRGCYAKELTWVMDVNTA